MNFVGPRRRTPLQVISGLVFLAGALLFVLALNRADIRLSPKITTTEAGGGGGGIDYCPPDWEDWSTTYVTNYAAAINSSQYPDCKYLAVMWCESHYLWNAYNGNHRGIYQFDYNTWTDTINRYLGSRYSTADICPFPVATTFTVASSNADYMPDRYIWSPLRQAGAFNYWVNQGYTSKWTCWSFSSC